jgi:hypothetical protein
MYIVQFYQDYGRSHSTEIGESSYIVIRPSAVYLVHVDVTTNSELSLSRDVN